jgi:hypothetical protein
VLAGELGALHRVSAAEGLAGQAGKKPRLTEGSSLLVGPISSSNGERRRPREVPGRAERSDWQHVESSPASGYARATRFQRTPTRDALTAAVSEKSSPGRQSLTVGILDRLPKVKSKLPGIQSLDCPSSRARRPLVSCQDGSFAQAFVNFGSFHFKIRYGLQKEGSEALAL